MSSPVLSTARQAVSIEIDGVAYYSADAVITHHEDGTVTVTPADGWTVYAVE